MDDDDAHMSDTQLPSALQAPVAAATEVAGGPPTDGALPEAAAASSTTESAPAASSAPADAPGEALSEAATPSAAAGEGAAAAAVAAATETASAAVEGAETAAGVPTEPSSSTSTAAPAAAPAAVPETESSSSTPAPAAAAAAATAPPSSEPGPLGPNASSSSSSAHATPTPSVAAAPPSGLDAAEDKTAPAAAAERLPLAEGLTEASPSVKREVGAVAAWRSNPTDPAPLLSLIQSSIDHSELSDARAWLELFLGLYPTAGAQYLVYVELELAHDNLERVERLFERAFSREPKAGKGSAMGGPCFPLGYPPLWTAYLHYIRRQNPLPPIPPSASTLPSAYLGARLSISQAYEFALSHVGLDLLAGPIWKEYLAFVREGETRSQWEEQTKVADYRALAGRAVRVPFEGVEDVWREYDQFEGQVNRVTAKKFLAERSPAYMTSRAVLKELRARLPPSAALIPSAIPSRPILWTEADQAVPRRWRDYLAWERSNPLGFEADELPEMLNKRVAYALRKCVGGEGRFFPELWHMAAEMELKEEHLDEAAGFLEAGLQANPTSFLLSFALAELEEGRKNYLRAHEAFTTLIEALSTDLTTLKRSIDAEVVNSLAALNASYAASAAGSGRANGAGVGTGTVGGGNQGGEPEMVDVAEVLRGQERERQAKEREVRARRQKEVDEKEKGAGLVWIMHMRFARRSEGIKAGRAVFAKARKFPHATWQVFEASALIEYHCSKDPAVATRIFELGLKVFGDRLEFVDRYLAFLIMINDDQNARVLFERSVTKFEPDESRGLWERWARYEYLFGDLASAQRLDARFVEAFPKDSATKHLARRHSYTGIDEIARVDLGFGARQAAAQQPQQQAQGSTMAGVPTGPRAIPTGPRATLNAANGSNGPVYAQAPVPAAAAAAVATAVAPPAIAVRAPVAQVVPTGPAAPPLSTPAPLAAAAAGGTSSPAKRPLEDDRSVRHVSVDRTATTGGSSAGERLSMRNEPLSKRHRADSPAAAAAGAGSLAIKREQSPMLHKLPDNKPSPSQNATLGWFVGLLPPAGMFDGPIFPVDEVMAAIVASRIAPIAPPPPTVPPPALGPPGTPALVGGGGYRYDALPHQAPPPMGYPQQQQQQQQHYGAPHHRQQPTSYGAGRPQAGGWRRG